MTQPKLPEVATKIVEILTPLSTEDRQRVISASLTLLGDEPIRTSPPAGSADADSGTSNLPRRVSTWMKQNGISMGEIEEVFHVDNGIVEVIASNIPGKDNKEKTFNAYILTGMAKFIGDGTSSFDDASARALCKSSGCLNSTNHAAYLNDKGNEFTGSKEKGWTLTAPGLKRGGELIKELNKATK